MKRLAAAATVGVTLAATAIPCAVIVGIWLGCDADWRPYAAGLSAFVAAFAFWLYGESKLHKAEVILAHFSHEQAMRRICDRCMPVSSQRGYYDYMSWTTSQSSEPNDDTLVDSPTVNRRNPLNRRS